ncbi:MAG: superoxide dismutase [Chlamydiota bacterium]
MNDQKRREQHQTSYKLPDLPYDYDALEPVISAEIMQLHHQKHHQAYVQKLNENLEKYHLAESKKDMEAAVFLQKNIRFNGGGHINHSIFWTILCPPAKAKKKPSAHLGAAIANDFGSFEDFQAEFNQKTGAIQGSGWGWLGWNKQANRLEIACLPNQDPLSTVGLSPLFGIDVWEHAYYLQYKNARPKYLEAIWEILDWDVIQKRWEQVL